MGLLELFILAVGLSMDAFAVSVCKGLAMRRITFGKTLVVGLWFGGFQALMPAVGYFLGVQFREKITAVDHWIAFILLGLIGANMIKEACSGDCEEENDSLDIRTMFLLAVATSIDALAVGITFAFLNVNLLSAVSFIGATTFILSAIGSSLLYRSHNVHPLRHRCEDRKCIRHALQGKGRIRRRGHPDPARAEDPAGTPWSPGILAVYQFSHRAARERKSCSHDFSSGQSDELSAR